MAIERFEDLIAWQRARAFCRSIYDVTGSGEFSRDFGLRGQIRRAAVSVMSNLAEGFERNGAGEFHQFLSVSKSSCAEVRSQLYVALDAGYLTEDAFNDLITQGEEVARVIGGLRASVATHRARPSKSTITQHSVLSTRH